MIRGLRAVSVAVLLLVATVSAGLAQGIEIGANVGLTRTSFGGDGDSDAKTGFSIGVVFGYNLSRLVAVRPEIAFVRKGGIGTIAYSYDVDPATGNITERRWEVSLDLDYLELQVPITVAVPIGRSDALKPRFYAGPAVAFETSCEAETVIHLDVYSGTTGERLASETNVLGSAGCGGAYRSVDFGVIFGAGVGLAIGNGAITADIRYNLGVLDIYEGTGSARNRTLQVLVGYAYRLSR